MIKESDVPPPGWLPDPRRAANPAYWDEGYWAGVRATLATVRLEDRVTSDRDGAQLARMIRDRLRPGAHAMVVYAGGIEVVGTPADRDELNIWVDAKNLDIVELIGNFPGWEIEDAR